MWGSHEVGGGCACHPLRHGVSRCYLVSGAWASVARGPCCPADGTQASPIDFARCASIVEAVLTATSGATEHCYWLSLRSQADALYCARAAATTVHGAPRSHLCYPLRSADRQQGSKASACLPHTRVDMYKGHSPVPRSSPKHSYYMHAPSGPGCAL